MNESMLKFNVFIVIAIAVLTMALVFAQIPSANSATMIGDKGNADPLIFMKEVMDLNTELYSPNLDYTMDTGADEQWKIYTLNSTEGKIQAICMIKDGRVVSCLLSPLSGAKPVFTHNTTTETLHILKTCETLSVHVI